MDKEKKDVTITLNRDKLVNILLVAMFVLLLFFGWQLYDLKETILEGSGTAAMVKNTAPTAVAPSAPEANPVVDIAMEADDHMRGNKNAKVSIVEYSDFECPFCGSAFPTVEQILDTYGDDVNLVYRHFPLSFHPQAQKAAEASECAADQEKFWELHDTIFTNQELLAGGVAQLKKWAGELGLNQSKFDSCLDSGEKAGIVTADSSAGANYGVTGTPAFFVNGTLVTGAQPFSAFKQVIDAELAS